MEGGKLYADSESTLAAIEERVLSCELCYERLQDPRLLACDHSFCARCCEGLAARSTGADRAMIACPTCGAGTTLPPGGVAQLRPNTTVTNMLELLKIFCPDQPGAKSSESRALGRARGEGSQLLQNLDDKEAKAREDAERMYGALLDRVQRRRETVLAKITAVAAVRRQALKAQDAELGKAEQHVARLEAEQGRGMLQGVLDVMKHLRASCGGALVQPVGTDLTFHPPAPSLLDGVSSWGRVEAADGDRSGTGAGGGGCRTPLAEGTVVMMLYDDGEWYSGWIEKFCSGSGLYVVSFPDGDVQQTRIPDKDVKVVSSQTATSRGHHRQGNGKGLERTDVHDRGDGREVGSEGVGTKRRRDDDSRPPDVQAAGRHNPHNTRRSGGELVGDLGGPGELARRAGAGSGASSADGVCASAVTIPTPSSADCEACRGKHRAHTCGWRRARDRKKGGARARSLPSSAGKGHHLNPAPVASDCKMRNSVRGSSAASETAPDWVVADPRGDKAPGGAGEDGAAASKGTPSPGNLQTTAEVVVKAVADAAFPIASTAGATAGGGRKKVVSTRPFSLQAGAVSSTTTLAPARTTQGVSVPAAVFGAMATPSQSAVSALGASALTVGATLAQGR